jgi:hypothetical protein
MKLWISCAALLGLTACHPADVNVKSIRERLEEGKLIEYTEPGAMRENCRKDRPAWDSIPLNRQTREQVVLGRIISTVISGKLACYKVGSEVRMIERKNESFTAGQAIVTRIAIIKLDALKAGHLKGQYWASAASVEREKVFIKENLKPDAGIVTIVDLNYIPDSAADEMALRRKEAANKPDPSKGLEQTTKGKPTSDRECNTSLTIKNIDRLGNGFLAIEIIGSSCAREGDLVELNEIQDDGTHKAIPVRVVERHFHVKKYTTTLILEPLGGRP